MYLNEKAWQVQNDDQYVISEAIKQFLQVYAVLARRYHQDSMYVPSKDEPYLRSMTYSIGQWLGGVDKEYQRLYLTFWNKRMIYDIDDEYAFICNGEELIGGTEAVLNHSFMVSIGIEEKWKRDIIEGSLYSVIEDKEEKTFVSNVYNKEQLNEQFDQKMQKMFYLANKPRNYEELWDMREKLFPHLEFCPSVQSDLTMMEAVCFEQILKKLMELEEYTNRYGGREFKPEYLSKTTPESKRTLDEYAGQHTFFDKDKKGHLASWHMRFTGGIPGRIFFEPKYKDDKILVCYIGGKLPNATYF